MAHPVHYLPAVELAAKIRQREWSSRAVVEACLAQIRAHNRACNAIVTLNDEQARAEADRADRDLAEGRSCAALHGVPVTIKDTYRVQGLRTTCGCLSLKDYVPDQDAVAVRLLREAGAIILGKTNTAALAMDMQADNPVFGKTNNPWDITRTSGGSSGGCAAALAAGMTPLSVGSDLAGSIRLPASFCGVYGLKPTHGVASMEGHIPPLPGEINGLRTLAVPGPLARSIDDLQLALGILTRPNLHDRKVAPLLPGPGVEIVTPSLRIAWSDELGGVPVSVEIKRKLAQFVDRLSANGATVVKTEPAGMDYEEIWELWGKFVGMQAGYQMSNLKRAIGDFFSKSAVKGIPMHRRIVGPISVSQLMQALETQSRYITKVDSFLADYDAWICPVSSTTAFKHHAPSKSFGDFKIYNTPLQVDGAPVHYYVATQSYTTLFATTDSPVVSMPIGLGDSGLPVNIQVIGKRYADSRLLAIAKALDRHGERFSYPLLHAQG